METTLKQKSEFIDLLSCFTFNIIYFKTKNPEGKLSWYAEWNDWMYDPKKDYWNFDISINGYKLENVLENWKKNKYGEFLEEKLNSFIEQTNNSLQSSLSKSDSLDFLNIQLNKLEYIKTQFYTEQINDEHTPFAYPALRHPKITINYSSLTKVYDEENDRFINELISFFINRQNEVIDSAISFLKRKRQWLEKREENEIKSVSTIEESEELYWYNDQVDLLELVVALFELKAFDNKQKNLTRKRAIEIFTALFNIKIKDAESKLSKATDRIDISPFLTRLKKSFEDYAERKSKKQEGLYKGRTKF